jgi:hypothetical protein
LTSAVIATISAMCGGEVHSSTAANSEPPAKLRPVISGTSSALRPFWAACAPSTRAKGMKPIITGTAARRPRRNSARGAVSQVSGRGRVVRASMERHNEVGVAHASGPIAKSGCVDATGFWMIDISCGQK